MCKGSQAVKQAVDAKAGSTLGIGTVTTHAQPAGVVGAFHAQGGSTAEAVHCVLTGQQLTLSNIPMAIQRLHGLRAVEVATFNQILSWKEDDQLIFERNSAVINLKDLAGQGIGVFVGVRTPDIKGAVDTIIAEAKKMPERELVPAGR